MPFDMISACAEVRYGQGVDALEVKGGAIAIVEIWKGHARTLLNLLSS